MSHNPDETLKPLDQADPEAMDRATYHRVVGPALQVAAETAAKRGHKQLFDDMPSMLALVDMVTRLADLHQQHHPEAVADQSSLVDNAATAACVMVFQEASLPPESINQCLGALESAYNQLQAENVMEGNTPYIAMAWNYLDEDDRKQAGHCLTQACEWSIAAIEAWRESRH